MNEEVAERPIKQPTEAKDSIQKKTKLKTEKVGQITVPAFASMLPVRTIGAL